MQNDRTTAAPVGTVRKFISEQRLQEYKQTTLDSAYPAKVHGNHVPATESANARKFLRNDNTWQVLPSSSTQQTGIVQLNDTVTSTSTTLAATANSVKNSYDKATTAQTKAEDAYKKAEEAFQYASDGKTKIATAITGKGVQAYPTDTFAQLSDKITKIETYQSVPELQEPTWEVGILKVKLTVNADSKFDNFRLFGHTEWQTSNVFSNLNPNTEYTIQAKGAAFGGDKNIKEIISVSPKANQAKPEPPIITATDNLGIINVSAPTGCKVKYNGTLYTSPYRCTLSTEGQNIFYSVKEATASLNESISDPAYHNLTIPNLTYPVLEPGAGKVCAKLNSVDSFFNSFRLDSGAWVSEPVFDYLSPNTSYTIYGRNTVLGDKFIKSVNFNSGKCYYEGLKKPEFGEYNGTAGTLEVTCENGCKILYNGEEYASPFLAAIGNEVGTSHVFRTVYPADATYLKTLSEENTFVIPVHKIEIPGPDTPIQIGVDGTEYYGQVTGLITGRELSNKCGITTGYINVPDDITWLKFKYQGRYIFIADRNIRSSISYTDLANAKCVRGGKIIDIQGNFFLPRLINMSKETRDGSPNGECYQLLYMFCGPTNISHWQHNYSWTNSCHDTIANRLVMGFTSVNAKTYFPIGDASSVGWRPVLEVL